MANFGEDEIGVGGDTSVKWNVDVHNVRPRTLRSDQEGPAVHQEGIAETPDNKAFTIAIKLPKGDKGAREKFLAGVLRAVKAPVDDKIVFALPIEEGNMDCATGKVDQIVITWPSLPVGKTPSRTTAGKKKK